MSDEATLTFLAFSSDSFDQKHQRFIVQLNVLIYLPRRNSALFVCFMLTVVLQHVGYSLCIYLYECFFNSVSTFTQIKVLAHT